MVAITFPVVSTAKKVPVGVASDVNHTVLVAVSMEVLALPKFCRAVHQWETFIAKVATADPGPVAVISPVRAVR